MPELHWFLSIIGPNHNELCKNQIAQLDVGNWYLGNLRSRTSYSHSVNKIRFNENNEERFSSSVLSREMKLFPCVTGVAVVTSIGHYENRVVPWLQFVQKRCSDHASHCCTGSETKGRRYEPRARFTPAARRYFITTTLFLKLKICLLNS